MCCWRSSGTLAPSDRRAAANSRLQHTTHTWTGLFGCAAHSRVKYRQMADSSSSLREHLVRALEWDEAHVGFAKAIAGIPPERRGERAPGIGHSTWDLLEHIRLAQNDLVEFCVNPSYRHTLTWPDDYWPRDAAPSADQWNASIASVQADRVKLQQLVRDGSIDLSALVPTGKGPQTYLRAILLVIDHNAYHVGQLIAVQTSAGDVET